jgi:hypothetical protein
VREATALGCGCGYPVSCQVEREGARLGFLAFFDDEPTSSTYGERIEHCPECGSSLALDNLLSREPHRGASLHRTSAKRGLD